MKQIDKHAYGPRALVTGASSGIGEEFTRQVSAEAISPEQAVGDALTALAEGRRPCPPLPSHDKPGNGETR